MNCGQVIFEILEQNEKKDVVEAINYCFHDLAECNTSEVAEVKEATKIEDFSQLDAQLIETYGDSLDVAVLFGM